MTLPADLAAKRFARVVQAALDDARANPGMTDQDIRQATGVGPSTFHRWRRAEWGKEGPQLDRVIKFFDGLKRAGVASADVARAMNALGVQTVPMQAGEDVDPMANPHVRAVLRKLADPKTSPQMRATINEMLRYLANLNESAVEDREAG